MEAYASILLVLLAGCETNTHRYQREWAEVRRRIEAIPVEQPVSQTNADILASTYWERYCSPCGVVYTVRDEGQYWALRLRDEFPSARLRLLSYRRIAEPDSSPNAAPPHSVSWSLAAVEALG